MRADRRDSHGILSGEIFFAEAAFCSVGAGAGSLPGLGQQPPSRGHVATDLADSDFLRVAMVLHLVAAARRRQDAAQAQSQTGNSCPSHGQPPLSPMARFPRASRPSLEAKVSNPAAAANRTDVFKNVGRIADPSYRMRRSPASAAPAKPFPKGKDLRSFIAG